MASSKYLIVFDTNTLYKSYNGNIDYTNFSFNRMFNDVISKIEEMGAIDNISIGIPKVVLHELKMQLIESFNTKIENLKKICDCVFPFGKISIPEQNCSYDEYIDRIMHDNAFLRKENVNIIILPFPSSKAHESLIHRALYKLPPFEGKDKKSDKGYKDALIWESILEFKQNNPEWNLLLSTDDSMFNGSLETEYKMKFQGQEIKILKCYDPETSNDIMTEISNIALSIDPSTYIPTQSSIENDLELWLRGSHFDEEIESIASELFAEIISSDVKFKDIQCKRVSNIEVFDINDDTHAKIECVCLVNFEVAKKQALSLRCEVFLEINIIDLDNSIIDIEDYSYNTIGNEVS